MTELIYTNIEAGTIECVGYCNGVISADTFAPGIWIGVRDIEVEVYSIDGTKQIFHITRCDEITRRIYHKIDENGPYFTVGDKLFIPEMRITYGI